MSVSASLLSAISNVGATGLLVLGKVAVLRIVVVKGFDVLKRYGLVLDGKVGRSTSRAESIGARIAREGHGSRRIPK